jgi:FecR-like protein
MIARFSMLAVAVIWFVSASVVLLFAPTGARADSIGDVVSVVPQANYQRSGAVQELSINDLLEQNDRVITTGDGSAYIHFIDDTVLTVGANSEVILDKFVFDGDKARTAVIQITRGTLRFVTGTSDHSAYQLKTPVATIGVRGTTIDVGYENDRMIYNTVEGLGIVCHPSAGCQEVRAGAAPLAVGRGGFARATAAEAARMLNVINRSHNVLSLRIGRNPGNMLAFAKDRGRLQALQGLKGLGPKGLGPAGFGQKGFGQKGLEQKSFGQRLQQPNLGQKPGLLQRFNQRFFPGKKPLKKYPDQK